DRLTSRRSCQHLPARGGTIRNTPPNVRVELSGALLARVAYERRLRARSAPTRGSGRPDGGNSALNDRSTPTLPGRKPPRPVTAALRLWRRETRPGYSAGRTPHGRSPAFPRDTGSQATQFPPHGIPHVAFPAEPWIRQSRFRPIPPAFRSMSDH